MHEHKWVCVKRGALEGSAYTTVQACKIGCASSGGTCRSATTGSGWSKWSKWSACPTTCTREHEAPTRSRTRFCAFPGGELYATVIACPGTKEEVKPCPNWLGMCKVDVMRATWGYHNCGKRGSKQLDTVRSACQRQAADTKRNTMSCRFAWKVGELGDPAPGCPKWFLTEYKCCPNCPKAFAEFPPK